jgi:glucuronosyltransferase
MVLSAMKNTEAGKVLVLSMQFGSHLNEVAAICEGLLKLGHTVHVVMDENLKNPTQFKGMDVEFLYYKSPDKAMVDAEAMNAKFTEAHLVKRLSMIETTKTLTRPRFTYDCKMALYDSDLVKRLENEKYDIAIADLMIPCYHLLAHKLGLPTVAFSTVQYTWHLKTHPLVNFLCPCDVNENTNTFVTRLKTFFKTIVFEWYLMPTYFVDNELFMDYAQERPYNSLQEIIANSTLFIVNKNGVIDCPTPVMQNLIQVGGLTTKPPKPLAAEYESYLNDATHGVIIVSFGSGIAALPRHMFLKFLSAFRNIKQKVIWRNTQTYGETLPEHINLKQRCPHAMFPCLRRPTLQFRTSCPQRLWSGHGYPHVQFRRINGCHQRNNLESEIFRHHKESVGHS